MTIGWAEIKGSVGVKVGSGDGDGVLVGGGEGVDGLVGDGSLVGERVAVTGGGDVSAAVCVAVGGDSPLGDDLPPGGASAPIPPKKSTPSTITPPPAKAHIPKTKVLILRVSMTGSIPSLENLGRIKHTRKGDVIVNALVKQDFKSLQSF